MCFYGSLCVSFLGTYDVEAIEAEAVETASRGVEAGVAWLVVIKRRTRRIGRKRRIDMIFFFPLFKSQEFKRFIFE